METPDTTESTLPIYDISGKEPVLGDMPHSQVHEAVASGKFSFPKGMEVSVVAPNGDLGTIPADQAPQAFNSGYQYATPDMQAALAEKAKYSDPKQQVLAGIEGLAQGMAGPLATGVEKSLGADPEEIRKRAEYNPWTHGLTEAAGFVGGAFTGTGEAALVGKAGETAAAALKLGGEGAGIASRIAAGATKAATEMSLIQAGDEASKAITEDPNQSVGLAAINVALSGLLGGVTGGALTGVGILGKSAWDASRLNGALKEFTDRLAYRGANLNPNEAMQHELEQAVNAYHEMGSEVGGVSGVKAQALAQIMPEMSEKITGQSAELIDKTEQTIARLKNDPLAAKLQEELDKYKTAISRGEAMESPQPFESVSPNYEGIPETTFRALRPLEPRVRQIAERGATADAENLARANAAGFNPYDTGPKYAPATSDQVFDATQRFKQQLQEWSKFSRLAPPPISERAFISATKDLAHEFRTALEDPLVWGRVAELQTKLNKAWTEAIPAIKDIESKFMSKVGNDRVMDPAKFNTYVNQNGKATTQTIRQQMMGNFLGAMEKFHDATDLAYQLAGLKNPHAPIGLSALKESIEKKSPWAKLADLYYDRAISNAAGTTIGSAIGGAAGHATGIPGVGLAGTILGGKLGEKILPGIIQPLMTKSLNAGALQQSVKFAEAVIKGNSQLIKSARNIFNTATETLPQHFMPSEVKRDKLNKQLEYASANPQSMFGVGGDIGHYMPGHQTAMASHAQNAVNYLESLRPKNPQMSPLDSKIPPTKAQEATFHRQLDIAEQPLVVLDRVKNATLLPQDLVTLKTLYPALYPKMVEQVTHSMVDHLAKGETIPYRLRQSLSMFTGQALDSTFTPASIQAAQATFLPKSPAGQPAPAGGPPKKSTAKLNKIATDAQTPVQAREQRANKV